MVKVKSVGSDTLNYEPPPQSISLTIRGTDLGGLFDEQTFVVAVENANDAPQLSDTGRSVSESATNGANVGLPIVVSLGWLACIASAETRSNTASSNTHCRHTTGIRRRCGCGPELQHHRW